MADELLVQKLEDALADRRAVLDAVGKVLLDAARAEDPAGTQGTTSLPEALDGDDGGKTPVGDLAAVLRQGPQSGDERRLLGATLALSIRDQLPSSPEQERDLARHLVWLTAHGNIDPFPFVPAALKERAGPLWQGTAAVAQGEPAGPKAPPRDLRLVAAAILGAAADTAALAPRDAFRDGTDDLLARLAGGGSSGASALSGELVAVPRGAVRTLLLTLCGWLAISWLGRVIGRLALAYRSPASLRATDKALELEWRTELLGRTVREHREVVPFDALAGLRRERRYGAAGLYAGLVALAVGSYLGMGLIVDGVRVPGWSLSLVGVGVTIILLGLFADFGFGALAHAVTGKVRLVVTPRRGKVRCLGGVDASAVDALLTALRERTVPTLAPEPAAVPEPEPAPNA